MSPLAGHSAEGGHLGGYRRLLIALTTRARRWGAGDPEAAAQEALKRSIENVKSRGAVEFYCGDSITPDSSAPEWPLEQLLAWLHAVLRNVIREEHGRASYRRETASMAIETADPAPGPLESLLQKELEEILTDCFHKLDRQHRTVLELRANGLKYGEIAQRMGVNE